MAAEQQPDWVQVTVVAPPDVAGAVLKFLQAEHGFVGIAPVDWCVLEREQDFARADYAPAEPITTNRYVIDWRKGEGRGDVEVRIGEQP